MQNNFDILKNKTNSTNVSSAKKNEKENEKDKKDNNGLKSLSKVHQWHDGLKSNSGYQRMQTMADIAATIIAGGSGG